MSAIANNAGGLAFLKAFGSGKGNLAGNRVALYCGDSHVSAAAAALGEVGLEGLSVVAQSGQLEDECFDEIILPYEEETLDAQLPKILSALKAGGKLRVGFPQSLSAVPDISFNLLMAGFVDTTTEGNVTTTSKTTWSSNSVADISTKEETKASADSNLSGASTWSVLVEEGTIDDDGLVDDDELMAEATPLSDVTVVESDCSTRRRACKNCSCGRAEMEEAEVNGTARPIITDEELQKSISTCGNCYKGDAFRCSGCPYLGKPAFRPDEAPISKASAETGAAITLDMEDDF
jgi:hypothetical protein